MTERLSSIPQEAQRFAFHEARAEEHLDILERRVRLYQDFRTTIDNVKPQEDPEQIDAKLDDALAEATMGVAVPSRIRFDAMREIAPRMYDRTLTPAARAQWGDRFNALVKGDGDAYFLYNVWETTEALKHKAREVQSLRGRPEKISGVIHSHFNLQQEANAKKSGNPEEYFQWEHVAAEIDGPFSITLVMKEGVGDSILEGARGVHLGGTPINVLREDDPVILGHEDEHNFMDGSTFLRYENARRAFVTRMVEETVRRLNESIGVEKEGTSEASHQAAERRLGTQLLNMCHNEILAALQQYEDRDFAGVRGLRTVREDTHMDSDEWIRRYTAANNELSTVGVWFIEMRKNISDRIGQNSIEPRTQSAALRVINRLENRFIQELEALAEASAVAQRLQIKERESTESQLVHGLARVVRPTQFHHIRALLEKRIGAGLYSDLVELNKRQQPVVELSLDHIHLLEHNAGYLKKGDVSFYREYFESPEALLSDLGKEGSLQDLGLEAPSDVDEYVQTLTQLLGRFNYKVGPQPLRHFLYDQLPTQTIDITHER